MEAQILPCVRHGTFSMNLATRLSFMTSFCFSQSDGLMMLEFFGLWRMTRRAGLTAPMLAHAWYSMAKAPRLQPPTPPLPHAMLMVIGLLFLRFMGLALGLGS